MDKILFIGSLNTKRNHFDGERIKTTLTFNVLKNYFCIKKINLSHFKIFNVFRFIKYVLFFRKQFRYIVISKDRGGAKLLHKILCFLKFDMNKVIYFQIGPFLYDIVKDSVDTKRLFLKDRIITVETESLKNQLCDIGFTNIYLLPNFKLIPLIECSEHDYPKKTLRLVYLSRVEKMKGIYQLINVLIEINKDKVLYSLDIFGMFMSKLDKKIILRFSEQYSWINYMGTISLDSPEKYLKLQKYDLHVFPTLYGEGFPGTIIDFFIAGVPTLSSNFARCSEILSSNESFIFKQGDSDDFRKQLIHIYNNQTILNNFRINSFKKRNEYGVEIAREFVEKVILKYE